MDVDERISRASGFDWDDGNRTKSWLTHQVSVGECEQVFFNQPVLYADDPGHSQLEPRWFLLGRTDDGRRLMVVFTFRGDLVRVISARDMSRKERREYSRHEEG